MASALPQRVTAAGYDYRVVAENLAKAEGDAEVPLPAGRRPQELDGVQGPPPQLLNGRFTEVASA